MIGAIIAVAVILLGTAVYIYAQKRVREQEAEADPLAFLDPEPEPEDILDAVEWWEEVWGPWHPEVPDLVVVDQTEGAVSLYDWKSDHRSSTPVVGPGRGREWHGT